MPLTFRPDPKPAIPADQESVGFRYRSLNRRMELTVLPNGNVRHYAKILLTPEQAATITEPGHPARFMVRRILHVTLELPPEAMMAYRHFIDHLMHSEAAPYCAVQATLTRPVAPVKKSKRTRKPA